MERHLLTWARASVLLIVPTGSLMFIAHANEFAENPAFRLKLLLLVSGSALNAAIFHLWPFRQGRGMGIAARPLRSRPASPPRSR